VFIERLWKLRRRRVVPADFTVRFLDRLHAGKLDCGGALDHCELNRSPAARIALAAVRRWGRAASDLERAVALAHRVETERLRRNVGTLRRIAALAPLLGMMGTLLAVGRTLQSIPAAPSPSPATFSRESGAAPGLAAVAWGPALANALTPLSVGIIMATIALVAYDGLLCRVEKLNGALDRLGAETIDAIALAAPLPKPGIPLGGPSVRAPVATQIREHEDHGPAWHAPHDVAARRDEPARPIRRHGQQETGF
jgi:biopolymer transport protein ExbB